MAVVVMGIWEPYANARVWVIVHSRNPAGVIPCGHVEDAGPITVVEVGRFELKLQYPLAREAWKSCQEGILLQFNRGAIFKDGAPTWIIS